MEGFGKLAKQLFSAVLVAAVSAWIGFNTAGGFHARPAAPAPKPSGTAAENLAGKQHFTLAISQWPGHMPFVIGNGGLRTAKGSAAAQAGLDLEIVFIEDAAQKNAALQEGRVDFVWQTVDELPIAMPGYKQAGSEIGAFLQIDWSRGGDACVASADVKRVEDVLGRKSAMLMFSPDHTVFEFMIHNSRLDPKQVRKVQDDVRFSMDDFTFGRKLFSEGKVDVACLWEPDVSLALKSRRGAHVLFSTADASELVADVVLAKKALLKERPEIARQLAQTWFAGVAAAEADRPSAARIITAHAPRFRDELGYDATLAAFGWVKWTTLADNARFFGLTGDDPAFDRVFEQADSTWTKYPQSGMTERFVPKLLRDDSIIRLLWAQHPADAVAQSPKYEAALAATGMPVFTKPISLTFPVNSAELDANAIQLLNDQTLPQLQMARAMHVRVEGNTDNSGPPDFNRVLSEARAKQVVEYFKTRGIAKDRISYKGNGDSAPIASNATRAGRAANRRTDILFIRTGERL